MEREELHRRIELLKKQLKEGKIGVAPHLIDGVRRSMDKIRNLPDGMVDPKTVDGIIRSMCMAVAMQNDRQEWKEIVSLKDIQDSFFQRVEYAFGQLFDMMNKANVDPYKFAGWFSSEQSRVKDCIPVIDEFLEEIQSFWDNISEPTWIHLEDTLDSKAVFTGELFPDAGSNVASSTGLYFDTTILPDPFLKIFPLLERFEDEEKCYDIVRLALQVLSYKSLALADLDKPIIAILPDRHHLDDNYRKYVHDCAVADSIEHTKVLFGQEIGDKEELLAYYSHFPDVSKVVKDLKRPEKLVISTDWDGSLEEQIMRALEEQYAQLGFKTAGQAVYMHLISRFSQANDAFQRSLQLRGTPIIRAETSWIWYNQMLEHNAGNSDVNSLSDLHIARALNSSVKNEMPWMGNIPPDALLEIRRSGAMDEIRHILKGGLQSLIEANPNNFHRTGDQVFDNLDNAFKDHEKKIKELTSKKWSFAGKDIGSFMVVGGIEITAAVTGLPLYGALGTMAGMTGAIPNVKDLKEKYKALKAEKSEINNTGVGILLKNKKI